MTKLLVFPILAMVLLTFTVAALMLWARVRAVRSGQVAFRYFRTYNEGTPTEDMLKTSQHFDNLFELPVLYYAGCLAAMSVQVEGMIIHALAWAFVVARVIHAFIHIGSNRIPPRMKIYFVSWFLVLGMWALIAARVVQS